MREGIAAGLLGLVLLGACTPSGGDSIPWQGYPEGLQQRIDTAEAQHDCDALNKWWTTAHNDSMAWLDSSPHSNDDALEEYITRAIVQSDCL